MIYNCYYLREICKNVEDLAATTRGQSLHPISGIPNGIYGFDLDTGDSPAGFPNSRQESRRNAPCLDSWKTTHPCPEFKTSIYIAPWPFDLKHKSHLVSLFFPSPRALQCKSNFKIKGFTALRPSNSCSISLFSTRQKTYTLVCCKLNRPTSNRLHHRQLLLLPLLAFRR